MKPLGLVVGVALLLTTAGSVPGSAGGPFDQKLSSDKQAVHVLNRLGYGPGRGGVEVVRRIGVEKWIRQQLRPEHLPQNPALESRLKAIPTLQMASREIFEEYQPAGRARFVVFPDGKPLFVPEPAPQVPQPRVPVTPEMVARFQAASPSDRRSMIAMLPPDTRTELLARVPAQALEGMPDLQAEAAKARQQRMVRTVTFLRAQPLNQLLTPEQLREFQSGNDEKKRAVLDTLDQEKRQMVLRTFNVQTVPTGLRREFMKLTQPQQLVTAELVEGKLYRALYSERQLEEVLVDFWLNHFNVYSGKGQVRMMLTSYERDAIRPHVFGRFSDMLLATARHPAMLFYLDNYLSQDPREDTRPAGPAQRPRRIPGLNENYGRELLELHTLGVDGGYTQDDVIAVARAFTGWTILEPNRVADFQFNPAMHDRNEKVVLGHTLPAGGGEEDGLKVIEMLSRHKSTAKFISKKLAQRFVADEPPPSLIDRMADTFARTNGDLRAVYETMLLSREFLSEGAWQAKTKSPLEMVVSALRALDADVTDTTAIGQRIADLGQPLYGKAEPTGYPNTGEAWANSAGLLGRMNFATTLSAGQVAGVTVDASSLGGDTRRAATRVFGTEPSAKTIATIEKGLSGQAPTPALLAAVLVGSPEFQKR